MVELKTDMKTSATKKVKKSKPEKPDVPEVGMEIDENPKVVKGVVHQILSPISNSETTIFFNKHLLW